MARDTLETLGDVRAAIDRIDRELVALLADRLHAIRRASEIKAAPSDALVEWRVEEVAAAVRASAVEVGFDPGAADRIWRSMMRECIEFERQAIALRQGAGTGRDD